MVSKAFLSYQTNDKVVAGRVKDALRGVGIEAFLAHEDIHVSQEWRLKILEEIGIAELFICLLSKNYFQSAWCVQESGIAAFRPGLPIIPLSLDGTIPQGFIAHLQSVKIDQDSISIDDLLPAFMTHSFSKGIAILIDRIAGSRNYRGAEANFQKILPFISKMTGEQVKSLLDKVADNDQVYDAALCARDYIPPLLKLHGRLLKPKTRKFLKDTCARYA